MRSNPRRHVLAAALVVVLPATTGLAFKWHPAGDVPCEAPETFYSAAHDLSITTPCCPRAMERCPGGVACVGPMCAAPYDDVPCSPGPPTDRPNVILFLSDDQGYCHYGFMGPGCRTSKSGAAVPVPATPNLDRLVLQPENQGRARLFEITLANSAFSPTARQTIVTGQLLKENNDPNVPRRFLPQLLQGPDGPAYCSFGGGGKVGSSDLAGAGFNASHSSRQLGKTPCEAAPCAPNCDEPPRCGADQTTEELSASDLSPFDFIDAMLIGPRVDGELDPGVTYTLAQPFFMWYGTALPHVPHRPPAVIEDWTHPPSPIDYLFGESFANPGQPRFPFADPFYALAFDNVLERHFPGLYGMIWWGDDGLKQLRDRLEGIQVWDAAGTQAVSLWERTVIIYTADHGNDLPRSKRKFTQNGYRSVMIVHDGGLAPSAVETRIERELTHAVDIMPTVLDYAGHTIPPLPGHSLRPYLGTSPPPAPVRNTVCGHETRSSKVKQGRVIRTRPGAVGRCAPVTGAACSDDADCAAGVCLLGTCGSGTLCLEAGDCPVGETCAHRTQRWCRYGRHPVNELHVAPVDQQPTTACATDADCVAACPSVDPLNCTCEYRELTVYADGKAERRLLDLFVDPDEPGLDGKLRKLGRDFGNVPIGPEDPAAPLAERLGCCLDQWWTPPPTPKGLVFGDPTCTACEPQYRCHRCGDGVVNSSEACDGTNLGGATCGSVPGGFTGGTLACTPSCRFDTSACTS